MKKNKIIVLAAMFCGLLAGCKNNEPLSLKIAHVNDTHSHFDEEVMKIGLPDGNGNPALTYVYAGGYPKLKTKIDQLKVDAMVQEKEFMLLHAGDAFAGTLFFTLFKGQLNADFMNYFEFDAMAIGNHEFDLGNETLAEFADTVNFPLLSANIKVKGRDPMHGRFLPFTLKMVAEQPVAIVGLTTEFTEIISSPSDDTQFKGVVESSRKVVKALTAAGINKIVFLTHLGLDEDKLLAQSVPGIDVIIGGHSPELLGDFSNIGLGNGEPSPVMEQDPNGNPVCIMHSGEHSKAIGVTDVEFSGNGIVESCAGQNVLLVGNIFAQGNPPQPVDAATYQIISDYIAVSPNIEVVEDDLIAKSMLDQAKMEVDAFASTVIGVTGEPLYHVRLPGDQHPVGGALPNGSMVAPHIAQSMAFKMEQTSGIPYVAMMNAGGVRADMVNEITVGTAYSVLPFSSTIVSMTVSGSSLMNTLSTNVANAFLISGVAFPYVANIRYTVNLTDPTVPTVENIQIMDSDGIYQPIDPSGTYNLVTTSYLAGGGDLYQFGGAENITDTGHVDAAVLAEYVEAQPGGVLNNIGSGILINR